MAVADPDLDRFRHDLASAIGVSVSEVGMLPDESHKKGGGYHCGRKDLISIGKFHPPAAAHVGSSTEDYSARQLGDRNALTDTCCAVDEPDGWGNGGNTAWIRANNMILSQMQAGDPALGALRAMNFTPDGKVRRRYDTNSPSAGVIVSTDTVLWHTHWEFWRWSIGTPLLRRTLARLLVITRAAIEGRPVPPEEGDDDMGATSIGGQIPEWDASAGGIQVHNIDLGIVEGGAADPRPAWLDIVNDTMGKAYALRIYACDGYGVFGPVPMNFVDAKGGQADGANNVIRSGWRAWVQLPKGTVSLSIARMGIGADGKAVAPSASAPAYRGSIGYAIERGAVTR